MELGSSYSDASSSREEDEVDEGQTDQDDIIATGMAQEIEAIKWERDALKREIEELQNQCRGIWPLKGLAYEVAGERKLFTLEEELKAEITENIMEERQVLRLRLETEEVRDQIKSSDKRALNNARGALKLATENLLDQRKAAARLEEQLNRARKRYEGITTERESAKLKCQKSEADCKDMRKNLEALRAERGKLLAHIKNYGLPKEQFIAAKVQCANVTKERDSIAERSIRSQANSNSCKKIIEALKVEGREFRDQFKDYDLMQKQLNTVREQCENIKKTEKRLYTKGTKTKTEKRVNND
ncbi:coiled-coil domain-containing protein 186-like [Cryptotermes secundus]|uniref:coiled-coil domain-containing protein 186-like n=1 Tax=Cryptotermes secundus TaxID=105785 RepID=UPI000CD7D3AF|nr:coiled-coil domain-containing protein 186-like [Cryptotermes secundus]